jgi:uncharacterized protein (DUF2267 family)
MNYDDFVGQVQHRARMASTDEAVHIIRNTLKALGERLYGGEVDDLAAQLPEEVGLYLKTAEKEEQYTVKEFLERVAELEKADYPQAVHHARAVMATVQEAITVGELEDLLDQLPAEYEALFAAGSEGEFNLPA